MSRRYTYARTIVGPEGSETFTGVEFDSFDEAVAAVEKGIHDRKLQIASPALGIGKGEGMGVPQGAPPAPEENPGPQPNGPAVPHTGGPRQP